MKKLLVLTVFTMNLLVVSQYAKAYQSCSSTSNLNWGGCSAWYGGYISQGYYKPTNNALHIEFTYSLGNPEDSDYVWGTAIWPTTDPSYPVPFNVGLNKAGWDIDPTPRRDTYYDTYSEAGYIEMYVYASGSIYGSYNEITCYASWW